MNKKLLIGGIIVVIAVAGIIIATSSNPNSVENKAQTLKDLMTGKLGQNIKCDFSYQVGESTTLSGTTYVAGEKVRVDYQMTPPINGQGDLHLVSDGQYNYIWGNSTLGSLFSGIKIPINTANEENSMTNDNLPEYVDYETPLTNCQAWEVNNLIFNPPADVDFQDFSQFLNTSETPLDTSENLPAIDCSLCDQLPAEQKNDCLASLGCE